jgi:hypothetical protein
MDALSAVIKKNLFSIFILVGPHRNKIFLHWVFADLAPTPDMQD